MSQDPEIRICINPYEIHDEGNCETKTWREITNAHAARTGLKAGDIWCDMCRKESKLSVVKSRPDGTFAFLVFVSVFEMIIYCLASCFTNTLFQ